MSGVEIATGRQKAKKAAPPGGTSQIPSKGNGRLMYTIYYKEDDTPAETRIGMVSAPNAAVAHRIAEQQFVNATIVQVKELTPPETETRAPGARFINGRFHPVFQDDREIA